MPTNLNKQTSIDQTEVHSIRNERINQGYLLNILTPPGYNASEDYYPVVYITDGGPNFTALASITPLMQMTAELTQFIIVGITYDVENTMHSMSLRARDLTQVTDADAEKEMAQYWTQSMPDVGTGGAAEFLRFINHEIKPYITSQFRVNHDDSTYAGYSLGGLFGLYALFNQPDSFKRYVIGSPSIWWANRDILQHENAYASGHSDLEARVFMSSGELEEPPAQKSAAMVTNMLSLAETLKTRAYTSLELEHTVLAAETHLSGIGTTLTRGIRSVFET